jgi:hypothetical protein
LFLNTLGKENNALCFSDEGCYFDVNQEIVDILPCVEECKYFNYAEKPEHYEQSGSFYTYKDFGKVSNFRRTINLKIIPKKNSTKLKKKLNKLI